MNCPIRIPELPESEDERQAEHQEQMSAWLRTATRTELLELLEEAGRGDSAASERIYRYVLARTPIGMREAKP